MAAYADGQAYEVEFETPEHVVLTLEGKDIQRELRPERRQRVH